MAVLTISREIGSGGWEIGRKVAEKTGYHFADKQIMLEVFRQYGFEPFDKVYESPSSFWDMFDDMRQMTLQNLNTVIETLAQHGNIVIVGRGSFAVLADLVDVVNVRVQAPFEWRLERFMKEQNQLGVDEAEELLADRGEARAAFVESTYNVPWDAASNFDLVINTEKVALDLAASWLVDVLKSLEGRDTAGLPAAKDFKVDDFMAGAVRGALKCEEEHSSGG